MNKNKIRWTYVSDMGTSYAVAATKAITDQAKAGGSAAATTVPRLPQHIKPRYVKVANGSTVRKVICYDTTCDLWTTAGTVVTLELNGADVVFTRVATEEATVGQRARDTTRQSA